MFSKTRRGFLGFMGISALSGAGLCVRASGSTEEPSFPFAPLVIPIPSQSTIFPNEINEPSFLHPNRKWVVLPSPEGGFAYWDWESRVPVQHVKFASPGDIPTEPCGGDSSFHPPVFSADGGALILGQSGQHSGHQVFTVDPDRGLSAEFDVTSTTQLVRVDPFRPLLHRICDHPSAMRESGHPGNTSAAPKAVKKERIKHTGLILESISVSVSGQPTKKVPLGHPFTTIEASAVRGALSSDGHWLVCFHPDKDFGFGWWAVWELPTGPCRAFRRTHRQFDPASARFSLDAACIYFDQPRTKWDWSGRATTSPPLSTLWNQPDPFIIERGSLRFSRKGAGRIEVVERNGELLLSRLIAFPPNPQLAAFGPTRNLLGVVEPGGRTWVWNRAAPIRAIPSGMSTDEPLYRPGFLSLVRSDSRSVVWTPDGRWLLVGCDNGLVQAFKWSEQRTPDGTPGDEPVEGLVAWAKTVANSSIRSIAFFNSWVACLSMYGVLSIRNLHDGGLLQEWQAHPHRGWVVAAVPKLDLLVTGGLDGLAIWSLNGARRGPRIGEERMGVTGLSVHPSRAMVAASFIDGSIAVLSLPSGSIQWDKPAAHQDLASAVAFTPDGMSLHSLGWDSLLRSWSSSGGRELLDPIQARFFSPGCLQWDRSGTRLALGTAVATKELGFPEEPAYRLNFDWDAECT